MKYNIRKIQDFEDTDIFQQYMVLLNARELLKYLAEKHEDFPGDAALFGAENLRSAMNYVDDVLIHGIEKA